MADRSLVTRLRTSGGPSEELLVLLDVHRVLTSGQLARLTGAPQRTVTSRLDRLLQERMVKFDRPGREVGSAPRHWWLTTKGARLVAGVVPAEGKKPSGMFAAHASSIAEVWLAVLEHGRAAGITGRGWWPDRAGWRTLLHAGDDVTLSPDRVLLAELSAVTGNRGIGCNAALSGREHLLWELLVQGRPLAGEPMTLRAVWTAKGNGRQHDAAHVLDRHGIPPSPARDVMIDYLTEIRPGLDYGS